MAFLVQYFCKVSITERVSTYHLSILTHYQKDCNTFVEQVRCWTEIKHKNYVHKKRCAIWRNHIQCMELKDRIQREISSFSRQQLRCMTRIFFYEVHPFRSRWALQMLQKKVGSSICRKSPLWRGKVVIVSTVLGPKIYIPINVCATIRASLIYKNWSIQC